jgi:3-isopropylmalate/(R)-2-methylmalate dehydratase small subunit
MFPAHLGIKSRHDKSEQGPGAAMQAFTTLTAIAAPLPMVNVDTDKIIPAKWLKTIKRTGLGVALFETLRYRDDVSEREDFVLNREPYRRAEILIVGENFGCGSSREHAPWALLDFGIRCVIAPSFADIFFNNCFKNGILPVVLPQEQVDVLVREASEAKDPTFTVDLEKQEVRRRTGNEVFTFEVDPFRKHCLLNGLDDVGLTMQKSRRIDEFEGRQRAAQPWLYGGVA